MDRNPGKPLVDAVFFDVDDTLFSTTRFGRRARAGGIDAMRRLGLRGGRRALIAELEEVVAEFTSNYGQHFQKLLGRIPARWTAGLNPVVLVAAAVAAYHDAKVRALAPYPDVRQVLPRLAAAGLRLGIITDGLAVKQAEKIVRLGVLPYLDPRGILISDQVGIGKPNPKLFLRACRALRVLPRRAVYVGDHPEKDMDPAKAVGMITVRMRRAGKYRDCRGRTCPDHEISSFHQLAGLLAETYGVRLPSVRRRR